MEAIRSSGTVVTTVKTTMCHNPEAHFRHLRGHENLRCRKVVSLHLVPNEQSPWPQLLGKHSASYLNVIYIRHAMNIRHHIKPQLSLCVFCTRARALLYFGRLQLLHFVLKVHYIIPMLIRSTSWPVGHALTPVVMVLPSILLCSKIQNGDHFLLPCIPTTNSAVFELSIQTATKYDKLPTHTSTKR
jgi:hypothetical protein